MPKRAKELTALDVKRLNHTGKAGNSTFPVGGVAGLLLQVTPQNGRSWLLRVTVGTRRREIGLGAYPDVSLAMAREAAKELKAEISQGKDPVADRKAARAQIEAEQRRAMDFRTAVDLCLAAKIDQFKNAKHRDQWRNTLDNYAMPELGQMLVSDIEVRDVLRVLEPIWQSKTETASRLRGRIETVLSWATVAGHRAGDNPARWRGNLKELLPAPEKIAKQSNHPALQIDDAARWLEALRNRDGMGARALEFAVLTASRSGEIRGAMWDEIDFESRLWIIPAKRMKMDREHRVPVSLEAVRLLQSLPRLEGQDLIFPGQRGGVMSDMALSSAMRRIHAFDLSAGMAGFLDRASKRPAVPHGLRSTFRDWVAERTHFPGDMAEIALAHKVANSVEASYRRGDMVEKRRMMMEAWSQHLRGETASTAEVIPFAKSV